MTPAELRRSHPLQYSAKQGRYLCHRSPVVNRRAAPENHTSQGGLRPVMLAPAMNVRMWRHPAVQQNVAWLREAGFLLVGPEEGWLACGDKGPGRMCGPEVLLGAVRGELLRRPVKRAGAAPADPS